MKNPFRFQPLKILVILLITFINLSYAKNPTTINILTWWGYLNHPKITQEVEKSCNVKISYDEYYTNDEFIRRWKEQKDNYDIVIFSYVIYDLIKKDIPSFPNSTLWKESRSYNPIIRNIYSKRHFPRNIVFFMHSLTGFLFNPNLTKLTDKDSISGIFEKAKNNIVIFIDDPSEAIELLQLANANLPKQRTDNELLQKYFLFLMKNSSIYIGNGLHRIYNNKNFAFSYLWSGEAIKIIFSQNKDYSFLIHPKLSYVSSDLLAQTNNSNSTSCVAKFFSSPQIINELQNENYYFSSYTNINSIHNPAFKLIYKNFLKNLPRLKWISSANASEFKRMDELWSSIKLQLVKNNYKGYEKND